MKKAYLSPELELDLGCSKDAILNSNVPPLDLGDDDWGVLDEF